MSFPVTDDGLLFSPQCKPEIETDGACLRQCQADSRDCGAWVSDRVGYRRGSWDHPHWRWEWGSTVPRPEADGGLALLPNMPFY